ncbi:hypothetical protein UC35_09275 [Ramlibacter tataouinensis]|uniref:Alkaline phytoceramidase n=1 Tax=Ramlibacter tataouinensis TaxID=94132 RepID=A0A127K1S8_9BURK|nr:hypothetical protein UC35_09275 [Ramlibacter tataouinensis]
MLAAGGALGALAVFGPAIAQAPQAHAFADQRLLWGIPHALDVLSNLPFALAGGWGLAALQRAPGTPGLRWQRACVQLFFIGLLLTAVGSSLYHLAPNDLGLAFDRGAMGVAFAGLLGMLAAARVSERAGACLAAALLALAPASVAVWLASGNVLPWAVVQFGGIALLLLMLALGPGRSGSLPVRWSLVLLAYAVAKLLEANDHAVLEVTGQLLSGHTLKHLAASCAAWPVIAALASLRQRQNARDTAALTA